MVRRGRFKLTLSSDIRFLDVAKAAFENFANTHGLMDEDTLYWCWVGLQEALVNAIRHGNGENPELPVVFDVSLEKSKLVMSITDQGSGVDLADVPDPTSPENLLRSSGRGFLFIRKAMDNVQGKRVDHGFTLIMEKQIG